jgi:hypothetical protein
MLQGDGGARREVQARAAPRRVLPRPHPRDARDGRHGALASFVFLLDVGLAPEQQREPGVACCSGVLLACLCGLSACLQQRGARLLQRRPRLRQSLAVLSLPCALPDSVQVVDVHRLRKPATT